MSTQADMQRRRARSISVPETASLSSSLRSIDILYEKLMHYLQENDQLKKQIHTLNEEHQSEITKLKEINSSLVFENTRLEKALYNMNENDNKVDQQASIQQIKYSQQDSSTLQQQQMTISNEIEELMRKCTEYQTELNKTRNELQDKNILIQSLNTQVKLKKEENDQLLEACNSMKSNLKNNHQTINVLSTNVKELVDECSQFRKDCTLSMNNIQDKFREQFKHVLLKRSQREASHSVSLSQSNL